ncbi:MAG TPA: hypothetical protein VE860_20740 [Chthoniobacterales bacterium]|nr:hypothetical protein [Chthoniobacterales bacterium]
MQARQEAKRGRFAYVPYDRTGTIGTNCVVRSNVMKSFAAFLLGIIIGVVATLYYPIVSAHPDQVNAELRKELNALQSQIRDLGNQLKGLKIPEPGGNNAPKESPSPSGSPSPQ